jgi:HlyD family secretion protein
VDPGPGHLATASPPAGCGSTGSTGGGRSSAGGIFAAEEQVNNAELALTQAQQRLAGTTIIAPSAGVVMSVAGVVGGTESPGGTGFIGLGDVSGTEVTAEFSEAGVANLAVGQAATIVLPDRSGQAYPGRVSEIDLAATTSGRLVRYGVRLAFDQVPTGLLYGESADVQVVTAHAVGVLYVPASAVSLPASGGQAATVTVRVNGRDVVRAVQIGLRGDRYTEIPSGLALGDQVVLTGGS